MQFHAPTTFRALEQRHCFRYLRFELLFHSLLDVDLCNLEDHAVTSMDGCGCRPSNAEIVAHAPVCTNMAANRPGAWPTGHMPRKRNCVTRHGWRSRSTRTTEERSNACMFHDAIPRGRGLRRVRRAVRCVAHGARAGRDAGSLEPRGGRAGEGRV